MPYSSATGASGVAHLACAYGVPIVSADISDFRQMEEEEGLAIDFYSTGDAGALAECLIALLEAPERQRRMAHQNFLAALRMTMPQIIHEYLRHFDREQRTRILRPVTRQRRVPSWFRSPVPMRNTVTRNWLTMALGRNPLYSLSGEQDHGLQLNRNARRSGNMEGVSPSADRDAIVSGGNGVDGNSLARNSTPTTECEPCPQPDMLGHENGSDHLASSAPTRDSGRIEDQRMGRLEDRTQLPVLPRGGNGHGGDGQGRTVAAGSDGNETAKSLGED
jgi:hypothetical protein